MMRKLLVVLLLLALPGVSLGQQGVDKYFSPNSQFYLRWDGFDGHREVFDKTAMGQMLKGDTGKFVSAFWKYLNEQGGQLLMQLDPNLAGLAKDLSASLESISKHGFAVSFEARKFNPPELQAVVVFPNSGGAKGSLDSFFKKAVQVMQAKPTTVREKGMEMKKLNFTYLEVAFGHDDANTVLVIGTIDCANVMRRRVDPADNITKHPMHKDLKSFKEFHVWAQGFMDVAGLAKSVAAISPEIAKFTDDLGLKDLKNITFNFGFDGPAERSVIDYHMPGPRKGLLKLSKGYKFSLKDLPPLPHDIYGFSAKSLDAPVIYDVLTEVAEGAVRLFSPDAADFFKEGIKQVELLLGVKLREDLFGSLGNLMVSYNSPSESPLLGLGSVTLIKMKDEKKLIQAADAIRKSFPGVPPFELEVTVKKFRGVDLAEVQLGPNFVTPTFAIHKGWLVWANYPQPVQGFILRSMGELPTWKMDDKTAKALAPFPKEFNSISVYDPAPRLQYALTWAPTLLSAMNGAAGVFLPGQIKPFDVSLVPHPLEATRHLFPNVSVSTDDGKRVRVDSRTSFPMPF